MNAINDYPGVKESLLTAGFIDDFTASAITNRWSTLAADAGSSVAQDADDPNGVVTLTTGATDNNEAYLFSVALGVLASGKPHLALALIQYAEANTDDANVMFALGSGLGGANTILDNGGGPLASYTGASIFKVDGDTRWQFESSVGATQTTETMDATAGGSSFQTLGLEIIPISATEFYAVPWIDTNGGNNLIQPFAYSANPNPRRVPIKHRVTWSSGAALMFFLGVKAGGANSEILKCDLAILQKKR